MSTTDIPAFNDVDVSQLDILKPSKKKSSGPFEGAVMYAKGEKPLVLQVKGLSLISNIEIASDGGLRCNYEVDTQGKFAEFLFSLDQRVVEITAGACLDWFSRTLEKDVLENNYSRSMRVHRGKHAQFRTKTAVSMCKPDVVIEDKNGQPIKHEDVPENETVDVTLRLRAIIYHQQLFSPCWETIKVSCCNLQVQPEQSSPDQEDGQSKLRRILEKARDNIEDQLRALN